MQVSIALTAESSQWVVEVAWGPDDARTEKSFRAARLGFTPWIGPGPDGMSASDDPDYELLNDTTGGLENLAKRVATLGKDKLQSGDLVTYGRLLFTSVLAPVWDTVAAEASSAQELVELALRLPAGCGPPLQTVLWELLHDGKSFLVTHDDIEVAITRRVPSPATTHVTTPDQITPPARVLFAIGAELSDPDVRAGAEFLGLMRELERSGSRIASCILESASPGRLEEAVKRFKPDVVHFIAHGYRGSDGVLSLLMRPEEDTSGASPQRVTADRLYSCIRAGQRIPPIVVLAACESGAVSAVSAAYGVPIAEDLVRRGVPVVVAMAGSVADQACRLFTRRFGTALASGGSLLQAAADARLAAYRRGSGPPSATIDWALPSIFLSDRIPHDYQPVAVTEGPPVSWRIDRYTFAEGPVFCGRGKVFRHYDELMSPGPLNILAIYSQSDTPGLGKSRLLREYGIRALVDGHVPCVVGLDGQNRPADSRRFAEALLDAITQARRVFQLPPPAAVPALLELLCSPGAPPAIDPPWRDWTIAVKRLLARERDRLLGQDGERTRLDADWLKSAIAADLARLIEDARAGQDPRVGPDGRVLVLLDSVEGWGDTVELLTPGILSQHGLGDEDEAAPVVMAFRSDAKPHAALFEQLIRSAGDSKPWIKAEKLEPFATGDEEGLAYRWILLNAYPEISPPISGRIYTVAKPDGIWRDVFGLATDRVPARLSHTKFYRAAQILLDREELKAGDDDEALAILLGSRS